MPCVVVGAVVAAPIVGPRLPLAEAHERFDLRRYQVPPFDPLAVPSPLVQLKASLKDERKDDVVFTVEGDTEVERWPVAVLTDYDGVVWTVADPDRHPDAAEFVPVDTQLPELDDELPEGARDRRAHRRDQRPRRVLPPHRRDADRGSSSTTTPTRG